MTALPTLPNLDGQIEAMEKVLQGMLILKGQGFYCSAGLMTAIPVSHPHLTSSPLFSKTYSWRIKPVP